LNDTDASCRIDVWLWRARFFKTRSAAAEFVSTGQLRMTRGRTEVRLDKPARLIKIGDELVFAHQGRVTSVQVTGLGLRRGPPAEARGLYCPMENS